jgi:hypothetical protein
MIDYEKLKLAHELAGKLIKPASLCINITYGDIGRIFGVLNYDYDLLTVQYDGEYKFTCVEHLIGKLQSLLKTEPKYKVGHKIWYVNDENEPEEFIISTIDQNAFNEHLYQDKEGSWWLESMCYPTRQALIEHQIEYWQSLRKEQRDIDRKLYDESGIRKAIKNMNLECLVGDCQHEPNLYGFLASNPPRFLCKKCGEFYQ